MRELDAPTPSETQPRAPSAWRWVARLVLVGFLALVFGFSYVYAPRTTTVFMFVLFFIGIVYLVGRVHELHREVRELRVEVAARRGKEEGKE